MIPLNRISRSKGNRHLAGCLPNFEVIQAHQGILELSSKDALTALEMLTHATAQHSQNERDNKQLWAKVRGLDEDTAHQESHRIVEFAKEHGATILVFEHLASFKPEKGRYSKRGNSKRSYQ